MMDKEAQKATLASSLRDSVLTNGMIKDAFVRKAWNYVKKNPWSTAGNIGLAAASFTPVGWIGWAGRGALGAYRGRQAYNAYKAAKTARTAYNASKNVKGMQAVARGLKQTRDAAMTTAKTRKAQSVGHLRGYGTKGYTPKGIADMMTTPISRGFTKNKYIRGATGVGLTGTIGAAHLDDASKVFKTPKVTKAPTSAGATQPASVATQPPKPPISGQGGGGSGGIGRKVGPNPTLTPSKVVPKPMKVRKNRSVTPAMMPTN